ncbi:proteasome subunit alpha [archaeon]|nr:MAG: proteasome subunit alpha [archaeon]
MTAVWAPFRPRAACSRWSTPSRPSRCVRVCVCACVCVRVCAWACVCVGACWPQFAHISTRARGCAFLLPPPYVQLGSCALGARTSEGCVLAVEKRITSPLIEQTSIEKVLEVDSHIGTAISGLTADARTLIEHARVECVNHRFTYDEPLPVESLTQCVCDVAMSFGEDKEGQKVKMSRPFGVSLLLAGVDARGPQLYHTDPSGTYVQYDAHAIGSGSEGARMLLQERYSKSMTLEQAAVMLIRVLTETMEEKITATNMELAVVLPVTGYKLYKPAELEPLLERARAEAAAETA